MYMSSYVHDNKFQYAVPPLPGYTPHRQHKVVRDSQGRAEMDSNIRAAS